VGLFVQPVQSWKKGNQISSSPFTLFWGKHLHQASMCSTLGRRSCSSLALTIWNYCPPTRLSYFPIIPTFRVPKILIFSLICGVVYTQFAIASCTLFKGDLLYLDYILFVICKVDTANGWKWIVEFCNMIFQKEQDFLFCLSRFGKIRSLYLYIYCVTLINDN